MKFFSGKEKEKKLLKTRALKNVSRLSKSSTELLKYLASKYRKGVFHKNKLKVNLESCDIYQDKINTKEILHSFLKVREDVFKKFVNLEINLSVDFEYYIRKVLDGKMLIQTINRSFYFIVLIILGNSLVCRLLQ